MELPIDSKNIKLFTELGKEIPVQNSDDGIILPVETENMHNLIYPVNK